MTLPSLTPTLKATLDYMADYERERGFPPTYEEIGKHFNRSKVTAWEAVQSLTKKGLVVAGERNTARNRRVCPGYAEQRALEVKRGGFTIEAVLKATETHIPILHHTAPWYIPFRRELIQLAGGEA